MTLPELLAWLLATAWQSTLVGLVLVGAAAVAASPHARRVLLTGGLLKFLVPASLTAPFAVLSHAGAVTALPLPGEVDPPSGAVAGLLLAAWAIGAAVSILRLGAGRARLRREISSAELLRGGPLLQEVREIAAGLGLTRLPLVYVTSDRRSGPRAAGILRPSILLPAGLATSLSPEAVRAVLAHELAHHRRRDLLLLALGEFVVALWWFHPVARLLATRLRSAMEEACDDLVLEKRTSTPDEYCTALLSAARFCVAPGSPAAAGFAAPPLRRRLRRIMTGAGGRGGRLPTMIAAAVVLALLPGAPRGAIPEEVRVIRTIIRKVEVAVPPAEVRVERRVAEAPSRAAAAHDG